MKLKKEIPGAAAPPEPKLRDAFLTSLPYPKLTYPGFILSQIGYIRKRVWLTSAGVLLAAALLCAIPQSGITLIWMISALVPFIAVLTAAEISRSDIFGMAEIEAGCRFAVPQVIGARMLILGICNFTVIAVLAVISGIFSPVGTARAALYIFTPYIAVNGISLAILSRVRGQDGVYLCAAAAFGISLAGYFLFSGERFGERITLLLNLTACLVGTVLAVYQIKKILFRHKIV